MPEITNEEYIEFLQYKKQKTLKELEKIEESLSKAANLVGHSHLNGNVAIINGASDKSAKGPVGWKYIIDEILKKKNSPMGSTEIIEAVMGNKELRHLWPNAVKSVGSALSVHSADGVNRYLFTKEKGRKFYTLNKDFVEEKSR